MSYRSMIRTSPVFGKLFGLEIVHFASTFRHKIVRLQLTALSRLAGAFVRAIPICSRRPLRPRPVIRLSTSALVTCFRVHAIRPHKATLGTVEENLGTGRELSRHAAWDVRQHRVVVLGVLDLLHNLHVFEIAAAAFVVGPVAWALANGIGRVADEGPGRVVAYQRPLLPQDLALQGPHRLDQALVPCSHLGRRAGRVLRFADTLTAGGHEGVAALEAVDEDSIQPPPW